MTEIVPAGIQTGRLPNTRLGVTASAKLLIVRNLHTSVLRVRFSSLYGITALSCFPTLLRKYSFMSAAFISLKISLAAAKRFPLHNLHDRYVVLSLLHCELNDR